MTTDTSTSATERATETASTAADQGKHVAGVAASEAKGVASEAKQQAKGLVDQALGDVSTQVGDQTRSQRDRLVGTLGSLGDDLHRMADQADSGLATDLAREAADRAKAIASHLDGREPAELLEDVRDFARQRPGTFLLGALAAGVVVGRLLRGTGDAVKAAEGLPDTTTLATTPQTMATVPPPVTPPVTPPSTTYGTTYGTESTTTTTPTTGVGPGPVATPGAPDTTSVHSSHGQPTQP